HRCSLENILRQRKSRRQFTKLRQCHSQVPLRRIRDTNPPLPLSQLVQLNPLIRRDTLCPGRAITPVDNRREPLVMNSIRHRRTGTRPLRALLVVKRAPLGSRVSDLLLNNIPASHADDLSSVIVSHEPRAPALRAQSYPPRAALRCPF